MTSSCTHPPCPPVWPASNPGSGSSSASPRESGGEQALSVHVLDPIPSVVAASRKKPDDMVTIIEDLIKLLDGVSNTYRRGRHPDSRSAHKVAAVLRAVADDLDV